LKKAHFATACLHAVASTVILLLASSIVCNAQFSTNGYDQARIKWYSVDFPSYTIIYPENCDSLAFSYGKELERYRVAEGISSGLVPGIYNARRTPVILHTCYGLSNGSVTWAPRRIDLYTLPQAYDPEPMPWIQNLAVHESRHMAQMQFGYRGPLKVLTWLLGDMAQGAYSAIWPNTWLLEGDAVTAETALTKAGRGRSADFLEYYKTAFDEGDTRDWYRWRYGSFRHYTPDHYALGYMTVAGARYVYRDTLFTKRYFDRLATNPFRFWNTQKTLREASGQGFSDSFRTIRETFHSIWEEDVRKRGEETSYDFMEDTDSWYSEPYGIVETEGKIYAVISGLRESPVLSIYDSTSRRFKEIRPFAEGTSRLRASNRRLWWSEGIPDLRWSLKMTSRIRCYDTVTGKITTLTKSGRMFNPYPSEDGKKVAAISLPYEGGSEAVVISTLDGKVLARRTMPDSLQAAEICLMGDEAVILGISNGGSALYRLKSDLSGELIPVTEPLPISIRNLQYSDGAVYFTCDRNGNNELYCTRPGSVEIRQVTSLRHGGDEFFMGKDRVYFTVLKADDRLLCSASCISPWEVDFSSIHRYKVAETLSSQEKAAALNVGIKWPEHTDTETIRSTPERYRKIPHIFRFHSWAPVYFDYDNISSLGGDTDLDKIATAGATALFQNSLGTAWGSVGYSFHSDPYYYLTGRKSRHSGHFRFNYSGLYPVFSLSADIGERNAIQYARTHIQTRSSTERIEGYLLDSPLVKIDANVYIPFNFSSSGWQRGMIPMVSYSFTNDRFDKSIYARIYEAPEYKKAKEYIVSEGSTVFMQRLQTSLRGYILRPTASSSVYPRFGIGAEAGYSTRLETDEIYSAAAYLYTYGYLPGITRNQGLKITARGQHQFEAWRGESAISVTPRGFGGSLASSFIRNFAHNQLLFTADYGIPIYVGDISCFSPFFYIRNFEIIPHFDYTMFSLDRKLTSGGLYSAGATLTAVMANLLWIPYDTRIGVRFGCNGGKTYETLSKAGGHPDRFYVEAVFSIDL